MAPPYRTKIEKRTLHDKVFVMETIFDLDEAIEQLCETLGDHPNPFAEDLCPYYGVLWPAAEGLAQYLALNNAKLKNKKVVEVGCGLAFPSVVARHFEVDILATDFHEDVPNFLKRNERHNSLEVPYQRFNWRDDVEKLGRFDVVIGSDVLYEPKHPSDVADGFERLLKPGGEVWLADPGRGYLQRFIDEMTLKGFKHELEPQKVREYEIYVFRFFKD
ncbi:MAG: class I SAM-dependent methyltransferase [Bacteriovoracia bacterium]